MPPPNSGPSRTAPRRVRRADVVPPMTSDAAVLVASASRLDLDARVRRVQRHAATQQRRVQGADDGVACAAPARGSASGSGAWAAAKAQVNRIDR